MALRQIPLASGVLDTVGAQLYEQTVGDKTIYYTQLNSWQSHDHARASNAEQEALNHVAALVKAAP